MTTLLHIASSSNLAGSNSRQIGTLLVESLTAKQPGTKVITRDLVAEPVPHVSPEFLGALFSGDANAPMLSLSNQLIDEVFASDILVLEAPMYNFGIPSVLKAWIDHVVRAGKTFHYTANGPKGLARDKKAILVLARGGIYTDGPFKPYDHQESYLRAVLGFIGITDVEVIYIEGVALGADKAALALDSAKQQVAGFKLAA